MFSPFSKEFIFHRIICDAITEIAFWRPGDDINWKRIKSPFGPIRDTLF
jgi:hypothetical protein